MRRDFMHYYQFHIGDYTSHTAHLSNLEDLAYRRLLDLYYDKETPIPNDIPLVSRRIRMGCSEVETVLKEFFVLVDDGWKNMRSDLEIREYHEFLAKQKANGKLGGRPKKTQAYPKPNPIETQTEPKITLTNSHKPLTNTHISVAKATGAKSPISTDEIIFSYGVPLLTNAGAPDKQARSFLGGLRKSHGDDALVNALRDCIKAKPLQPLEWLAKALPPTGGSPKRNKQEQLEDRNRAVVARMIEKEQLNAAE